MFDNRVNVISARDTSAKVMHFPDSRKLLRKKIGCKRQQYLNNGVFQELFLKNHLVSEKFRQKVCVVR